MRAPTLKTSVFMMASLLASLASAQELTLFEQLETQPVVGPQIQPQNIVPQNGMPVFTVRGTMRVGDEYRASLVDRNGVVKQVRWRAGEAAEVPEMQGYQVLEVKPRSVVVQLPAADPCVDAPQLGVSCNSPTLAVLTMSTAAPLPPSPDQMLTQGMPVGVMPNGAPQNPFEAAIQAQQAQQAAMQQQGFVGGVQTQNGQQVYVNPFNGQPQVIQQMTPEMQAAREARQRARAGRLGAFQPVTIPDDQIPAGMRRVRTPFGDQLQPERE